MQALDTTHERIGLTVFARLQPNAGPQLLPEAGAQRTLEAVGCRPMLGSSAADAAVQREGTAQSFWVPSDPILGAVPWKAKSGQARFKT
jgi:hypothetical protein